VPRYLFGDFDHRAVVGVGDARTVAAGHTWLETFRARVRAEGLG
jgi:hypothetical protein